MIKETVDLLGRNAVDKVTGFDGVITSVCFDLYGCVQVVITPPVTPGGDLKSGNWFDVGRVTVSDEAVMPVPTFAAYGDNTANYDKGCADKPLP